MGLILIKKVKTIVELRKMKKHIHKKLEKELELNVLYDTQQKLL